MVAYRTATTRRVELTGRLDVALSSFGFEARDLGSSPCAVEIAGAWVRKTWNTNRGVVHLCAPPGAEDLGEIAQEIKMPLGKALGYFPFFYGMGLQVVWSGEDILERASLLDRAVDSVDNQRCIVQSLFAVDFTQDRYREARTWGQVITGKFQDAITSCLDEAFVAEP